MTMMYKQLAEIHLQRRHGAPERAGPCSVAWKYQNYFECDLVKDNKNINVHCTFCIGKKLLFTVKNSTSNLSDH